MHCGTKGSQGLSVPDEFGTSYMLHRAKMLIVGSYAVAADPAIKEALETFRASTGYHEVFGRRLDYVDYAQELWVSLGDEIVDLTLLDGEIDSNIEMPHHDDWIISWYTEPGDLRRLIDEGKKWTES